MVYRKDVGAKLTHAYVEKDHYRSVNLRSYMMSTDPHVLDVSDTSGHIRVKALVALKLGAALQCRESIECRVNVVYMSGETSDMLIRETDHVTENLQRPPFAITHL